METPIGPGHEVIRVAAGRRLEEDVIVLILKYTETEIGSLFQIPVGEEEVRIFDGTIEICGDLDIVIAENVTETDLRESCKTDIRGKHCPTRDIVGGELEFISSE
jgi:hypothetical protein